MHPIHPSLPHICHGSDSAESVEWYDPIVESEASLSDRDLQGALNRTREQLERAVQQSHAATFFRIARATKGKSVEFLCV